MNLAPQPATPEPRYSGYVSAQISMSMPSNDEISYGSQSRITAWAPVVRVRGPYSCFEGTNNGSTFLRLRHPGSCVRRAFQV